MRARITHGLSIDSTKYADIAYFDNDILATRPIDPFFQDTMYLRAMDEQGHLMNRTRSTNGGLSAEEKSVPCALTSVVAGIFVASGSIFHDIMNAWKDTYAITPNGHYRDQWALNAMIFRNKVPYKGFGYDVICPASKPEDIHKPACLLHYWANRKKQMPIAWGTWKKTVIIQNPLCEKNNEC